jgi:flavin-dependent dehydrogenase
MENVDVIIIGAGPAGCSAAIRARQAGLSVTLIEANPSPKKAPGETLHPGIEALFAQLGIAEQIHLANFPRHRGVWFDNSGLRKFIPYGEDNNGSWFGYQADRKKLQHILQQGAIDNHANLIVHCCPDEVIWEENRVVGVLVNNKVFRSKWTIDATGRQAWLAKKLALSETLYSPPLSARFGWRNETHPELDNQPCFTFHENGWKWTAPVGDNQIAWSELSIGKPSVDNQQPKGLNVTWSIRPESAGLGYFLLGDAAAMLDPASSHGVLRAVMSGIMVGYLLAGYKSGTISEQQSIETYRTWLQELFAHDVEQLREQYANSPAKMAFNRKIV